MTNTEEGTLSYQSLARRDCGKKERSDPLFKSESLPLLINPRENSHSPSTRLGKYGSAAVLLLCCISMTVYLGSLFPTEEEVAVADRYGVSILNAATKIRAAQKAADNAYMARFVYSQPEFEFDKARMKMKKGGAKVLDPPEDCEGTVIILRHCEKGGVREHCTHAGFERSVYLATLFGDEETDRWPSPSYIYAEAPYRKKKKMNFREIETIGPLAVKSNITVNYEYNVNTVNELAQEILTLLQTGELCGKVALVSWKHSSMGHLARHLGCGPLQGCPVDYKGKMFDAMWHIKFVYRELTHSHRKDLEIPDGYSWGVYGSVQMEGFDPLAFSKTMGDYPPGGTDSGGRWMEQMVDLPERTKRRDHKTWARIQEEGLAG